MTNVDKKLDEYEKISPSSEFPKARVKISYHSKRKHDIFEEIHNDFNKVNKVTHIEEHKIYINRKEPDELILKQEPLRGELGLIEAIQAELDVDINFT